MFKTMRNGVLTVAAALLMAATAHAQYKTPAPTNPPGNVQVAPNTNSPIQISTSTVNADDDLSKARRMKRDEAMKLVKQKKAVWVDVRSRDAYAESHIPGAINIPLGELQNHFQDLPFGKFLITYCA